MCYDFDGGAAMKDLPLFTLEWGVVSLTMQQIPYTQRAYVRILQCSDFEKLVCECESFCRAAGAQNIYITGHECCESLPVYTHIWEMTKRLHPSAPPAASLFPATQQTLSQWLEVYNPLAVTIANGRYIDRREGIKLLSEAALYFVHQQGQLLGIGAVKDDEIMWISASKPGNGETVLNTLCSAIFQDTVRLQVSSENKRALAFYQRNGFSVISHIGTWYILR